MPDAFDQIVSEAIDNGHTGQLPPRQAARRASAPSRVPTEPLAPEAAGPRRRQRTDPGILVVALYLLAAVVGAAGVLGALIIAGQEGGVAVGLAAGLGSIICAVLLAAAGAGLRILGEINEAT